MKFLITIFVFVNLAIAGDLEAPAPYSADVLVSTNCIAKIQAVHNVMNGMFENVPAASALTRNDAMVPFIQTNSVFTPLTSGKKTVKYKVTGVLIGDVTGNYYLDIEDDDGDIDFSGKWRVGSVEASVWFKLAGNCSDSSVQYGQFYFYDIPGYGGFSLTGSGGNTTAELATFCTDKNALVADKIDATSASAGQKTAAKNMLKSNVTISALCTLWGF